MMALIDVVSRLVGDVGRFVDLFLNDLILGAGDPISALLVVVVGQILLGGAMAAFGYAVVGALLQEIGVTLPSLGGRGPTGVALHDIGPFFSRRPRPQPVLRDVSPGRGRVVLIARERRTRRASRAARPTGPRARGPGE